MPASNRTPEFFAAVESARLRGASAPEHKQRLLQQRDKNDQRQKRTEFTKAALKIAKELQGTMLKLDKLAQRAHFEIRSKATAKQERKLTRDSALERLPSPLQSPKRRACSTTAL